MKTMKHVVPDTCSICGRSLKGVIVTVGTGNGSLKHGGSFAHGLCYDQAERLFKKGEPLYDYAGYR